MPDLQEFSVTRAGSKTLSVPTWTVSVKVTDSTTGAVISDHTGVNAVSFPQALGQMTAAQQDEFVAEIVMALLRKRGIV